MEGWNRSGEWGGGILLKESLLFWLSLVVIKFNGQLGTNTEHDELCVSNEIIQLQAL